ncbi:glycoside hydrolase family 38 C-terminal domain-containing protein [Mucilaginibacter sp. CSA2-8R]|uniref:glycoside hydrolase family 38 C-terminal domain-containing protein n=1 Tax=Mucilaginibacter sp. CSA2-8R TaxID=3141542 RepID=UPI00315D9B59
MLPQILSGFGFKFASLKNPNTCFGGYTRAYGNELVKWTSADGSSLITSPRYAIESLYPQSTWQTIGWDNSKAYITAAFKSGIEHPIGMTLQDAGWKNGPFLGKANQYRENNAYTTWRNYFSNVVNHDSAPTWHLSQEDVLVSLVWGSQVTQRIAQQVRNAENNILQAERLIALTNLSSNVLSNKQSMLDSAWRTLLLAQHHDCWIVPYNGDQGDTWADKVNIWTKNTVKLSKDAAVNSLKGVLSDRPNAIVVFNTQAANRKELVAFPFRGGQATAYTVCDASGKSMLTQTHTNQSGAVDSLLFMADVPAFGYANYLIKTKKAFLKGASITKLSNGIYQLETDLYVIQIDPVKGGAITNLITKKDNFNFVDPSSAHHFNSLRGNFNADGGMKTSASNKAAIDILEKGPLRIKVAVKSKINDTEFTQTICLDQGQPIIDFNVNINWQRNEAVGDATPKESYKWTNYYKAFYNDSNKLVITFPTSFKQKQVYKNAPFDVVASKLDDTFFSTWDSIKNNVILNWVDITDETAKHAMALFTDHTTSYTHGKDFPLGLVAQYSGMGLWGRDYFTDKPTNIHYALLPHIGKWNDTELWQKSANWNQPLEINSGQYDDKHARGYLSADKNLIITTAQKMGNVLKLRVFNADINSGLKSIHLKIPVRSVDLVDFNNNVLSHPALKKTSSQSANIYLQMPAFGVKTILVKI